MAAGYGDVGTSPLCALKEASKDAGANESRHIFLGLRQSLTTIVFQNDWILCLEQAL